MRIPGAECARDGRRGMNGRQAQATEAVGRPMRRGGRRLPHRADTYFARKCTRAEAAWDTEAHASQTWPAGWGRLARNYAVEAANIYGSSLSPDRPREEEMPVGPAEKAPRASRCGGPSPPPCNRQDAGTKRERM